jgi:ABC-type phosphate transport system substrate-binding protein
VLFAALVLALVLAMGMGRAGNAAEFGPPVAFAADTAASFRIIVQRENSINAVSREFLSDVFLAKATRWGDGEPTHVVDQRFDSPVRQRFSDAVLRRPVSAVRSYWQQLLFSGRGLPPPELESDDAVIRYVQSHRGAVGYVSPNAATNTVKVISYF